MSKIITPARVPRLSSNELLQGQLEEQLQERVVPVLDKSSLREGPPVPPRMSTPEDGFNYADQDVENEYSIGPTEEAFDFSSAPASPESSYFSGESELFKDDVDSDMPNDINPNAQLYPDVMSGTNRGISDAQGQAIPAEEIARMRQQEIDKQSQTPKSITQLIKAKNEKEIVAAYPDALKETGVAPVMRASRDFALALNNQTIQSPESIDDTSNNGLQVFANGLGSTTRSAANTNVLAFTSVAPALLYSDAKPEDLADEIRGSLTGFISEGDQTVMDDVAMMGGTFGTPLEALENITGNIISTLNKNTTSNSIDAQGNPINPSSLEGMRIPPRVAGAMHVSAGIDAGYYQINDVNGVPYVSLTPKGMDYYGRTRELQFSMQRTMSGRAQKVPVSDTGDLIGAQRNVRGTDIKSYGYKPINAIKEVKRIMGSIGKLSSPTKGYFGLQMFKVLLQQLQDPQRLPVDGIDAAKFFKIEPSDDTKVVNSKLNLAASEFFNQAGFMADGTPNYTRYKEGYSTHRLYEDSVDFNEQRNKMTRAMMVFSSAGMQVNRTNYHNTGITSEVARKHWETIGAKARKRDTTFSSEQRELNFLALLGRVLDVGKNAPVSKTENMIIPEMMSLITPEFISQAAAIGAQLRSLVPSSRKSIVNEILSVVTATDTQFNRGEKTKAGIYKGNPGDIQPLFGVGGQQMTEAQKNAVKTWMSNSDRETWGYTLQGYLDAAAYMDAKSSGKLFTPRSTVAIDMNSAGRAFIAMDVGNETILSRVGLLWEEFSDKEFQDVVGKGDPRAYFTDTARDYGIDEAFGTSNSELNDTWKNALFEFGGPGADGNVNFNKAFGKKVLLTTDYGKPMQYHLEEAMAFLNEYPDFKNKMLSSSIYDGDYKKLVTDLNKIYTSTLSKSDNAFQYSLPKNLVEILQMFGSVPKPTGVYGEQISVGKYGRKDEGEFYRVSSGRLDGTSRDIPLSRKVFDPRAKAKDKNIKDLDGNLIEAPGAGTAARNQVGPVMGQYRESIVMMETARLLNEGKDPANMLNMSPVFDNFILDADSYLYTLYTANNIVVPKVMEWNMAKAFIDDFQVQINGLLKEVREGSDNIVIGPNSKYLGVFDVLDRNYKFVFDRPKSDPNYGKDGYGTTYNLSELSPKQRTFRERLESASSGYKRKGERGETEILTKGQLQELVQLMAWYKNIKGNSDKWTTLANRQRQDALEKLRIMAAKGLIYFFT